MSIPTIISFHSEIILATSSFTLYSKDDTIPNKPSTYPWGLFLSFITKTMLGGAVFAFNNDGSETNECEPSYNLTA